MDEFLNRLALTIFLIVAVDFIIWVGCTAEIPWTNIHTYLFLGWFWYVLFIFIYWLFIEPFRKEK
jgi:hypothetical protein